MRHHHRTGVIRIVTPPADGVYPIDVDDAKRHLKIEPEDNSENDTVKDLIATATKPLEGPEGWLGRALITQTLELRLDCFPYPEILLPCPPLQLDVDGNAEHVVVRYIDTNGALQTVDSSIYRVLPVANGPARIVTAYGKCWPCPRCEHEAVRIEYRCGYGDAPDDVDAAIRHAMRLMISHLYQNREAVSSAQVQQLLIRGYDSLLSSSRIFL